jgi:hypothetical protein
VTALLAGLFTIPIMLTGFQHALLLLPLSLAVAVVYKTARCEHIREIPVASAVLCVTIVVGMYAVGVGLWLLHLVFT